MRDGFRIFDTHTHMGKGTAQRTLRDHGGTDARHGPTMVWTVPSRSPFPWWRITDASTT